MRREDQTDPTVGEDAVVYLVEIATAISNDDPVVPFLLAGGDPSWTPREPMLMNPRFFVTRNTSDAAPKRERVSKRGRPRKGMEAA